MQAHEPSDQFHRIFFFVDLFFRCQFTALDTRKLQESKKTPVACRLDVTFFCLFLRILPMP